VPEATGPARDGALQEGTVSIVAGLRTAPAAAAFRHQMLCSAETMSGSICSGVSDGA
jgi:hypothetical protein